MPILKKRIPGFRAKVAASIKGRRRRARQKALERMSDANLKNALIGAFETNMQGTYNALRERRQVFDFRRRGPVVDRAWNFHNAVKAGDKAGIDLQWKQHIGKFREGVIAVILKQEFPK